MERERERRIFFELLSFAVVLSKMVACLLF
jgi:hypothetical protein